MSICTILRIFYSVLLAETFTCDARTSAFVTCSAFVGHRVVLSLCRIAAGRKAAARQLRKAIFDKLTGGGHGGNSFSNGKSRAGIRAEVDVLGANVGCAV